MQRGIRAPVVLVGHSLGGRYQWVHAALYPQDVAGLVLLEPTHPDHLRALQAEAPGQAALARLARLRFSPAMAAEFDAQDTCLADRLGPAQRAAARRVPARLLARSAYGVLDRGAFEVMHRRLMRDWLTLLKAPGIDHIDRSGHNIQRDRPDAVVAAVRSLTASLPMLRAAPPGP